MLLSSAKSNISLVFLLLPLISLFLLLSLLVLLVLDKYVWRVQRLLAAQGLKGPPPKFLQGNMADVVRMKDEAFEKDSTIGDHDLVARICPYYSEWSRIYGRTFVFWWGTEARITVTEPEMIKEILCTKAAAFGKSHLQQKGGAVLLGNGLIMANGENWAHRRHIVSRAFRIDKIKAMVPLMLESTQVMLGKWQQQLDQNGGGPIEVDVYRDVAMVTADIIARTAFGSSYAHGTKLFHLLTSIQKLLPESNKYLWLPGSRFLPTAANKKIMELKRQMQASLKELIEARRSQQSESSAFGNDLLGLMLSASQNSGLEIEQLIEECQTFFFVGHETTLMLVTWTLMLLCLHPEWQSRAREEVDNICSGSPPTADMLSKMKTVGIILNESLRLYPPAPNLVRAAVHDTNVGNLFVPRGTTFWIPILAIQHDTRLWGPNAHEFRPERFNEPSSSAPSASASSKRPCKYSMTEFLPFSFGPRICVGQTFALMEAKLLVATILQHYNLRLSPSYKHSPVSSVTLRPKHGMQLIITPNLRERTVVP